MSGDGFQVLMSDLLKAAGVFDQQSVALGHVMPADGPIKPDAGGSDINQALQAAVWQLASMNTQLAGAISNHAALLRKAHAEYTKTENEIAMYTNSQNNLNQLATQITNPDNI